MAVSPAVGSFLVGDYVVFALMLLLSAAIGVHYAVVDRGQKSSHDFLTGGRSMTAVPVSISLTASFMSAITVLATPAEVYRYGASFGLISFSYILVVVICSEIFLPVFYRLGITSTYEYLEMRFNRATRLIGTVMFIIQTMLYSGIVIYAPALALNQVTNMDLWGAVISTGVVCTFYCTLGGLKAVVWTDVFQMGIMVAGFLSVIIQSLVLRGGFSGIISDSEQGGRLNFWDFDANPLRRHTFWTLTFGGTFLWTGVYGINQAQVQRYISCKSITHARMALYINMIGLWLIMMCAVFAGLCLYSVYKHCDPWTAGLVSASDQLMPYLVMDILRDYPGLPGLFVAAAYSGTLSTVSSSINALAAVTVEDLIKPYIQLSEKHLSWTSKGLSFLYGGMCIVMAGLASLMDGLLQAAMSIFGIIGGPLLGLFSLGILCPFANSTGGLTGLMAGLFLSLWLGIGAQFYPPLPEMSRPLPLTTFGCKLNTTGYGPDWNITATTEPSPLKLFSQNITDPRQVWFDPKLMRSHLAANWYSLSYLYFSPIGTLTTLAIGLIVSILSGGLKMKLESRLMLIKEDLTFYYFFKWLRDKATRWTTKTDLTMNRMDTFCNRNAVFFNDELDLTKDRVPTSVAGVNPLVQ